MTELEHKASALPQIFRIEAKMYVPAQKYSTGVYQVKLLEPIAEIALAEEHLMDNGAFSFDSTERLKEGRRFKIEITGF